MQKQAQQNALAWIDALQDISTHIANLTDVDMVLIKILEMANQFLESEIAALALLEQPGQPVMLKYLVRDGDVRIYAQPEAIQNPDLNNVVKTGKPACYAGQPGDPDISWQCMLKDDKVHAAAAIPLFLDSEIIGLLWIGCLHPMVYIEKDILRLQQLGAQAVLSLVQGNIAGRLQSMAIIEERSRISSEMHDNLAQVLGYLNVQLQTLQILNEQGNAQAIHEELIDARQMLKEIQDDLKQNILSLHTTLSGTKNPIDSLRDCVRELGLQTGLETHFESRLTTLPRLSPTAEVQLMRIVQEALTNIRKHAHAHSMTLLCEPMATCFRVTIQDDGIGFDLARPKKGSIGLTTMKERATSVGGELTVASDPGKGTCITICLPEANSAK